MGLNITNKELDDEMIPSGIEQSKLK